MGEPLQPVFSIKSLDGYVAADRHSGHISAQVFRYVGISSEGHQLKARYERVIQKFGKGEARFLSPAAGCKTAPAARRPARRAHP
jgi:hypothetical protein